MALQHTVTTEAGVTLSAYIRVARANVTKEHVIAFACVLADPDKVTPVDTLQYVFPHDLDGENAIKQAYLHMKTLPEYAGAVDV